MVPWCGDWSGIYRSCCILPLPEPLWRKLRTTNVIERCFVEVRRRTRPMVCFINVASVDRIIYSIFSALTWNGKTTPSSYLHKRLDVTATCALRR